MKAMHAALNLDEEVNALADFISQRWEPITDLPELFAEVRDVALHDARGWLDNYMVSMCAHELYDARQKLLSPSVSNPGLFDAVCHFLLQVSLNARSIHEAGRNLGGDWDFSRRANRVYYAMSEKYPALANARPLGWDELAKDYIDYAGQEEYNPREDIQLFNGVNSEFNAAPGFHIRTALPYVMYDEMCHGRKAARMLVAAAYGHFLFIAEQLHAYTVCDALRQLGNLHVPELAFEVSWIDEANANPFIKVLKMLADAPHTKAEYDQSLAAVAEFNALSTEEQEARVTANKLRTTMMLKSMSRGLSPEMEAANTAREEKLNAVMREVFGQ